MKLSFARRSSAKDSNRCQKTTAVNKISACNQNQRLPKEKRVLKRRRSILLPTPEFGSLDHFKSSLGGSSPNHFTYILVNSPLARALSMAASMAFMSSYSVDLTDPMVSSFCFSPVAQPLREGWRPSRRDRLSVVCTVGFDRRTQWPVHYAASDSS